MKRRWFDWLRLSRPALGVGSRVRIVDMDGCMAHVRGKVEEGRIELVTDRRVYGDTSDRPWASIRMTNGQMTARCLDQHLWTRGDDGVMEYRQ